jgi:hypothetical protein
VVKRLSEVPVHLQRLPVCFSHVDSLCASVCHLDHLVHCNIHIIRCQLFLSPLLNCWNVREIQIWILTVFVYTGCARLRDGCPYVKGCQYNPKHL